METLQGMAVEKTPGNGEPTGPRPKPEPVQDGRLQAGASSPLWPELLRTARSSLVARPRAWAVVAGALTWGLLLLQGLGLPALLVRGLLAAGLGGAGALALADYPLSRTWRVLVLLGLAGVGWALGG